MEDIQMTFHATDRMRERCGLSKKSSERMANIAYANGLRHAQMQGRLKKWANGIYLAHHNANDMRIYGDYLYLFKSGRLITIFRVPNNLKSEANQQCKGMRIKREKQEAEESIETESE